MKKLWRRNDKNKRVSNRQEEKESSEMRVCFCYKIGEEDDSRVDIKQGNEIKVRDRGVDLKIKKGRGRRERGEGWGGVWISSIEYYIIY